MHVHFWVPGIPKGQGSLRSFKHAVTGAVITPQDPKVKSWRGLVAWCAMQAYVGQQPAPGPVRVDCVFVLPRPKTHYRTGNKSSHLRTDAPEYPTKKNTGDIDKLLRAILDAMTGIIFDDDSQVVDARSRKIYVGLHFKPTPGVFVVVSEPKL